MIKIILIRCKLLQTNEEKHDSLKKPAIRRGVFWCRWGELCTYKYNHLNSLIYNILL